VKKVIKNLTRLTIFFYNGMDHSGDPQWQRTFQSYAGVAQLVEQLICNQ
jgi:hypothetical protein